MEVGVRGFHILLGTTALLTLSACIVEPTEEELALLEAKIRIAKQDVECAQQFYDAHVEFMATPPDVEISDIFVRGNKPSASVDSFQECSTTFSITNVGADAVRDVEVHVELSFSRHSPDSRTGMQTDPSPPKFNFDFV